MIGSPIQHTCITVFSQPILLRTPPGIPSFSICSSARSCVFSLVVLLNTIGFHAVSILQPPSSHTPRRTVETSDAALFCPQNHSLRLLRGGHVQHAMVLSNLRALKPASNYMKQGHSAICSWSIPMIQRMMTWAFWLLMMMTPLQVCGLFSGSLCEIVLPLMDGWFTLGLQISDACCVFQGRHNKSCIPCLSPMCFKEVGVRHRHVLPCMATPSSLFQNRLIEAMPISDCLWSLIWERK